MGQMLILLHHLRRTRDIGVQDDGKFAQETIFYHSIPNRR